MRSWIGWAFACLVMLGVEGRAATLINGARNLGEINPASDSDVWTFTAQAGDALFLRIGTTNFTPRLRLFFDPTDSLIATASQGNTLDRDDLLAAKATNAGVYRVVVDGKFGSQTGTYALYLAQIPGSFTVSADDEGEVLPNGVVKGANLTLGDLDLWTFDAHAGDSVNLRVGSTNFTPRLRLYSPTGVVIGDAMSGNSLDRDDGLFLTLTNVGTYTLLVTAKYINQTGSYGVNLAQIPGSFGVAPGDESGALINGRRQGGTLALGDLDLWSFSAKAGDDLLLRVGSTNFTPALRLFAPDGKLLEESATGNGLGRDEVINTQATAAGTYTLVVSAKFQNQQGSYSVNLAQVPEAISVAPGDESGPLVNGVRQHAELPLGDLDLWTFTAKAGDALMLRVGSVDFTPWLRLLDPNGALVANAATGNGLGRDEWINAKATNAGTYTLVVSARFLGQAGSYDVSLARSPATISVGAGDESGALGNGVMQDGTLTLGDLDVWSFTVNTGDEIAIRLGATDFTPWLRLFGPDGALVDEANVGNGLGRDDFIGVSAPTSGVYTLVVSAKFSGQTGPYQLNLAHLPGDFTVDADDEGGELSNGLLKGAQLSLGDLDLWKFTAAAGQSLMLRVGSTNFTPWIRLYGPDGGLIASAANGNGLGVDDFISAIATNAGTYTVLVAAKFAGQSGSYGITVLHASDPIIVAPGDEGGALQNGAINPGTLGLGDLDIWTFAGTRGDSNVFRLAATNFTPWIRLYGPAGALMKETTTGNSLARDGLLTFEVVDPGLYTLVVSATFRDQRGTYALKQSRVPPDLLVPDQTAINETETLSLPISAQDPDNPNKTLTFALLTKPAGMILTVNGPTNATLSWPTTEADGPSTNDVVATVTDFVNGRGFTRTNSFKIIVNEVNRAPVLALPGPQILDEQSPLPPGVQATATDPDLPPNTLSFSLLNPPSGLTIDAATGQITWVPDESQGPGTYSVSVIVTDENPPAVNAVHLSVTNSFSITVREVNRPPLLATLPEQHGDELVPLTFTMTATDPDLPANGLVFSLVSAPVGMAINAANGVVTWTPTEDQGPGTTDVLVRVQDTGTPGLAATNTVRVVVREVNVAPQLSLPAQTSVDELSLLTVTATATDSDLPKNNLVFGLVSAPSGMKIDAVTGVITWTPTEEQGPSTTNVLVRVSDDGVPPLSTTNQMTVVVREVNVAPVLTPIPAQETPDETTFRLTVHATDADIPANHLTYSLGADAPPEVTINATTGELAWPIGVKLARVTQPITVRVLDNGSPAKSTEATILVTVIPPLLRLVPVPEQHIDETSLLTVRLAVTNSPQAQPPFTYALQGSVPDGLTLTATTGVLFWRPAEAQGPSTNPITVRVTDSAFPANTTNQTFNIIVREVNVAPVIGNIPTQNTGPGALLSLTVTATDDDLPPNHLTFSLDPGAPVGMTLQATSGMLTWTVPPGAAGTTNPVTVRVKDDGNPIMEATRTFKVIVGQPAGLKLAVELLDGPRIRLRLTGDVGQTYLVEYSEDLKVWKSFTNFVSTATVTLLDEVTPLPSEQRYYRATAP